MDQKQKMLGASAAFLLLAARHQFPWLKDGQCRHTRTALHSHAISEAKTHQHPANVPKNMPMNLEEKLNTSLNDILRTSGYVFEIINNNKRQSNLIAGPNNQLIPPPMMEQLAQKIAGFELILDDTVLKFNDVPWCIDQIVQNKKKQDEQKVQEELERKQREDAERKRQAEEEKRRLEEEEAHAAREKQRLQREQQEQREEQERRDRMAREQEQREQMAKESQGSQPQQLGLLQHYRENEGPGNGVRLQNELMDAGFDLDMDMDKNMDTPNPSDILSMNFKESSSNTKDEGDTQHVGTGDLDVNMMKGNDSLLDDLNMDLLGEDFDGGLGGGGEEEFDVENFLNQFGHGD